MQQRFRRVALFIGTASLAGLGFLVACGTDNGTTPVPVGTDSAVAPKDGGGGTDSSTPDEDGDIPDAAGVDCSSKPILRDNTAGFRCAFKAPDSGSTCLNTEECCNTADKASGPAFCANAKGGDAVCAAQAPVGSTYAADSGAKAWECADKSACGANEVCCMIQDPVRLAMDPKNTVNIGNTPKSDTKHPFACGVQRAYNEGGSRCRTTCAAGEIKLCSMTDNSCGAGTTCTPFIDFTNFVDRGFCK